MKLKFENFIESKEFNSSTKDTFKEAIICYKNSAYRASLLMSYLGFMEIIKYKINTSEPAQNYDNQRWKSDVIFKINNEEVWDRHTYEILIRDKNPIFSLSQNIKTQLEYWKDRRNDCAHLKKNNISNSHIEAFWEFIESNIDKFIINDSVDFIVNLFLEYFNSDYKLEQLDTLISKVYVILNKEMFKIFLETIRKELCSPNFISKTDKNFNFFGIAIGFPDELKLIYSKFIIKDNPEFREVLEEMLSLDQELYYDICKYDTRIPNFIAPSESLLKNFYDDIVPSTDYREDLFSIFLPFISSHKNKENAYNKFLRYSTDNTLISTVKKDYFLYRDFLEFSKNYLFRSGSLLENFNWANNHKKFILFLIDILNYDDSIIAYLENLFSRPNYPYDLRDAIYNAPEAFKEKYNK